MFKCQRVTAVLQVPYGVILTLACKHKQWRAGPSNTIVGDITRCIEYPCYRSPNMEF